MTLVLMGGLFTFLSCSKDSPVDEIKKPTSTPAPTPEPVDELVKIAIAHLPAKTVYSLGEELDLTGLVVEGVKKNNDKVKLDIKKEDVTGFSSEKAADEQTLTVTIQKLTTTFTVRILPIKVENGVLTKVDGNLKELVLPDFVKKIGTKVFQQSKITKLTLNEGLTEIEELAFGWSQISEINFPQSLVSIAPAAFYACKNLYVVDLSKTKLTKIAHETFAFGDVRELTLPAGIKDIESQAFIDSKNLKALVLPEGLLRIGNEAFRETGLVSVKMPNSVSYMDQRAFFLIANLETVETYGGYDPLNKEVERAIMEPSTFEGCSKLKSFAIPKGVKIVGQNTLTKSPDLTSMVIPATVEQINFNAFGNASLKTVVIEGKVPAKAITISGAWYGFPDKIESIRVPAGTSALYKQAEGWKSFAKVIVE